MPRLSSIFRLQLVFLIGLGLSPLSASTEVQVRAAFLFNFLQYTIWPQDASSDDLIVAVTASAEMFEALRPLEGRFINGRALRLLIWDRGSSRDVVPHVHFMETGDVQELDFLIGSHQGSPVLLVGSHGEFLIRGGHINLVRRGHHIRFEVNLAAATRSGLVLQSRMLRLAERVL